jgi:hypothetical protein
MMPTAFIGRTQKPDPTIVRNQQKIFERMLLLLAAVMEALLIGVCGSLIGRSVPS